MIREIVTDILMYIYLITEEKVITIFITKTRNNELVRRIFK